MNGEQVTHPAMQPPSLNKKSIGSSSMTRMASHIPGRSRNLALMRNDGSKRNRSLPLLLSVLHFFLLQQNLDLQSSCLDFEYVSRSSFPCFMPSLGDLFVLIHHVNDLLVD